MRKNFTLIEVAIVIVIFGIIATFAIPAYHNALENANAEVCAGNLSVLLGALEAYGLEEDEMPGSLGKLEKEHLQKGWAKTFKERGYWRTKLAYFLVDFDKRGLAYAQVSLVDRYLGGVSIVCPSSGHGENSYGIHGWFAAGQIKSYDDYRSRPLNFTAIADCDADNFVGLGNITERHRRYRVLGPTDNYGLGISRTKVHQDCRGGSCSSRPCH